MDDLQIELEKLVAHVGLLKIAKSLTDICYDKSTRSATEAFDMTRARYWLRCATICTILVKLAHQENEGD
jgi:hypothetical protein